MSDVTRRAFISSSAAFQLIRPDVAQGQQAGAAKLRAGLIGVGGRGRQAVNDLLTGAENVEVVAMADIFEDQLEKNLKWLKEDKRNEQIASRVNVSPQHRFVGFEAYKKLLASDIDIVMLATPPGYRPMHFEAAVDAKKHIFCEKPFGTDPVGVRRFMAAAKRSEELKLTVGKSKRRYECYNSKYYLLTHNLIFYNTRKLHLW